MWNKNWMRTYALERMGIELNNFDDYSQVEGSSVVLIRNDLLKH